MNEITMIRCKVNGELTFDIWMPKQQSMDGTNYVSLDENQQDLIVQECQAIETDLPLNTNTGQFIEINDIFWDGIGCKNMKRIK